MKSTIVHVNNLKSIKDSEGHSVNTLFSNNHVKNLYSNFQMSPCNMMKLVSMREWVDNLPVLQFSVYVRLTNDS